MTKYKLHTEEVEINDASISKHKDFKKLLYNYQKATKPLYLTPLYKNKKAFLAVLLIVLLAYLISEFAGKKEQEQNVPSTEQIINE